MHTEVSLAKTLVDGRKRLASGEFRGVRTLGLVAVASSPAAVGPVSLIGSDVEHAVEVEGAGIEILGGNMEVSSGGVSEDGKTVRSVRARAPQLFVGLSGGRVDTVNTVTVVIHTVAIAVHGTARVNFVCKVQETVSK